MRVAAPNRGDVVGTWVRVASRLVLLLLAVLTIVAAAASWPLLATAQTTRSFVWDRVDVTVTLQADGTLHVTERDLARFSGGPFRRGFRDIPLARIERIDNVRVARVVQLRTGTGPVPLRYVAPDAFSMDVPNTFTVRRMGTTVRIEWSFPATTSASRTFQINYVAHGALRVYPDHDPPYQQISWAGVDRALTEDARVNAASLTFILPRPVDPDQVIVDGPGGSAPEDHTADGKTWTWGATNLGRGDSLGATLEFPPLVSATKPAWQDASDRREQLMRERGPQLTLFLLGLALLIAIGGGIAVLAVWWTRGRDPEIGPVPDILVTPPADLPPAVVGALVDEQVDQRDIVATLVDLGRRGILRINPGTSGDFSVTLLRDPLDVSPFEGALLATIFGSDLRINRVVALSEAKAAFDEAGSRLRSILYDELVQHGFFPTRPSRTRILWEAAGVTLMVVAAVAGWASMSTLFDIEPTVWMPGAALLALGALVWFVARVMPRKTVAGAKAAAEWRAFGKYLKQIDEFEQLDMAQDLFDRYLPYAIVFEIETSWITTFSRVATPAPRWWGPHVGSFPLPSDLGGLAGGPVGSGGAGPSLGVPSLQGLSNQMGQSLQASSEALFGLFNSAGETFSGSSVATSGASAARGGSGFSGSLRGVGLVFTILGAASGGGGGGFS
jgi:Predicted membrane protein (DUF2207)